VTPVPASAGAEHAQVEAHVRDEGIGLHSATATGPTDTSMRQYSVVVAHVGPVDWHRLTSVRGGSNTTPIGEL